MLAVYDAECKQTQSPLLLPHYDVVARDKLEERVAQLNQPQQTTTDSRITLIQRNLDVHSDAHLFRRDFEGQYTPIPEDTIILTDEQLRYE